MQANEPLRFAVLLSGGGRTLENLQSHLHRYPERGSIVQVVADRASAGGLARAERHGIEHTVLPCRSESDAETIFALLEKQRVDYVLLAGFLRFLTISERWQRRVLNIHPSLIPKYCGAGFYGHHVHEAVVTAGELESGCTVHFVDNIYDHGPILLQKRVPVLRSDDAESLAERVFAAECEAYVEAVDLLAADRVRWHDGRPGIIESEQSS